MLHVKFECFDYLDISISRSFLGYFCLKKKQAIFLDIESQQIVWHELGGAHKSSFVSSVQGFFYGAIAMKDPQLILIVKQ